MAQTVSNLTDILKEVWTQDTLAKQFYDEYPWLDRLEKTNKYTIGKQAQVPIHKGRAGATTVLSSAGGTLNAADAQRVDQGVYGLAYNWNQVALQFGALNQAAGGAQSVVDSMDLEVSGATQDQRKDVTRQFLGNGDGLIAQCTTTGGSTTVNLLSTGYGYDAIVRGWLRPGQTVDIGTTSNETFRVADSVIASVSEVAATPTITIGSSVTTASTDYVSIANARSGATSNESVGLRSIAGSNSTVVGTIDPGTDTYWKPAQVDTTTTAIDINLPLSLQQNVFQKTGKFPTFALTSIKQLTNLYSVLQNQVRFSGDVVRAGNVMSVEWNGMKIEAQPDVPDKEFYLLTPDDLLLCTGKYTKPTWASDVEGAGGKTRWVQGGTSFVDAIVWAVGLGVRRRNSQAAAIGLTA